MYCKFGDKIVATMRKVSQIEFPETANNKIRKGVLSEDNRKKWDALQKESEDKLRAMLDLLNEMDREEENYRYDQRQGKRQTRVQR